MTCQILVIALLLLSGTATGAEAQSTWQRTFDPFVVTVGPEDVGEGTWFRIDWTNGHVGTFLIPDVFDPQRVARDLSIYSTTRLVIRSSRSIVIVNSNSGTVVDRIAALQESQSPSGRYLAIQRHTPNGVEFVDAVYSIYDLEKTPAQKRPQNVNTVLAGWIVYPPANVAAKSIGWLLSQAMHMTYCHRLSGLAPTWSHSLTIILAPRVSCWLTLNQGFSNSR